MRSLQQRKRNKLELHPMSKFPRVNAFMQLVVVFTA
jgi:hypothetical protein